MMWALRLAASSAAMSLATLPSTSLSFAAMSSDRVRQELSARLADMLEAVADLASELEQHGPHVEEFAQFTACSACGEPLSGKCWQ